MKHLESLMASGYKLGLQKSKYGDGDDFILFLPHSEGEKQIVLAAKTRQDLEDYAQDNYEELMETLEDYQESALEELDTDERLIDEDAEYWCEDCDSALELMGSGIFGEFTAWCPTCGEYKSIF